MSALAVYGSVVHNAFLKMLAYRMRYITGIITYLLYASIQYFLWKALFQQQEMIRGYSLPDMITYVTIGWLARSFYFSNVDEEIDSIVSSGQVSIYLLRPVSFQIWMYCHAFGEALFRLTLFCLPLSLVYFLVFPLEAPPTIWHGIGFLIATFLGFFVFVGINFIVGLLSFSLYSLRGVIRAKYFIIQLSSGLLLPLSFFPPWLEFTLQCLPFHAIAYTPLEIYLGRIPSNQIFFTLLEQSGWVIGVALLASLFWNASVKRLTLHGG